VPFLLEPRQLKRLSWLILLVPIICGMAAAQSQNPVKPPLEILGMKWEKQARLPRNFDPSVIPENGVFSTMESRTAVSGSTQAPLNDAGRRDAAERSAALAPVDYFPKTPARMPVFYIYSIKIRNVGSKAIQGVAWDYLFINPTSQAVLGAHHVLSYNHVKASQSATLKGPERTRPTKVVSAVNAEAKQTAKPLQRAVIQCVLYEDGTSWQNSARADACDLLRKMRPAASKKASH